MLASATATGLGTLNNKTPTSSITNLTSPKVFHKPKKSNSDVGTTLESATVPVLNLSKLTPTSVANYPTQAQQHSSKQSQPSICILSPTAAGESSFDPSRCS